jgi:hypothetical protein
MIDSREIATLVWLTAGLIAILVFPATRQPLSGVVRAALHPQILIVVMLLGFWVMILVLIGSRIGIWNSTLIKGTLIWFVTAGLVMMFYAATSKTSTELIHRIELSALLISFVLAFYLNFHVFSLPVELMLQPFVAFLGVLAVVAGSRSEYAQVESLSKRMLGIVGLSILLYSTVRWVQDWQDTAWSAIALQVILPLWLSIGLLPFVFGLHVFSGYKRVTTMITYFDSSRTSYLKTVVALACEFGLDTNRLSSLTPFRARRTGQALTLRDKRQVLKEFLSELDTEKREADEAQQRLVHFAGVQGVDEFGCQLDQREFEETRRALLGLGSSQMGWYRNRGGRYCPELIELLEPRFERDGLPSEHGITLKVSEDGQKWYAWRRTVSGWCFAIGAARPPPNQWLYDGADPPGGFPGEDPLWGSRQNEHATNW